MPAGFDLGAEQLCLLYVFPVAPSGLPPLPRPVIPRRNFAVFLAGRLPVFRARLVPAVVGIDLTPSFQRPFDSICGLFLIRAIVGGEIVCPFIAP